MKKRIFSIILIMCVLLALLVGCTKPTPITYSGEYYIHSATLDGKDVTKDFSNYDVTLKEDGTMVAFVNYKGRFERRNSTYTATESVITESYKNATYTYNVVADTLVTTYVNYLEENITVTLAKKVVVEVDPRVDFEGVLFGEDISETKKFNYCPAIIVEPNDQGQNVMHIWYCTNKVSGVIMDHIGYRTGVQQENGKWIFSDEQIVLAPTPNTWDSRHTCDPAVIKGEFKMKGETYNYLMSYLGCTTEDYQKNETGLAVAKDIGGPWVKLDNMNPIVPWYDDGNIDTEQGKYESWQGTSRIYWGTGMPSLLSIDGKGKVILLYQSTLRGTGIRFLDLSDLDNPVLEMTTSLSSNGVQNPSPVITGIGIPDFAYDPATDRLYVVSVTQDKNPPDETKTLVNSHSYVAYLEGLADMNAVAQTLKTGGYQWKLLGWVGPEQTGWTRNHNPGLVRDSFGCIPDPTQVQVVVSTGRNDKPTDNIYTYRLHGWTFPINL